MKYFEFHLLVGSGGNPIPQWKPKSPSTQQNSGHEKDPSGSGSGTAQQPPPPPSLQTQQQGQQAVYPVGNQPPLSQKNEHIFNHKGGGIMDPSYGNQLQQQKQHANPNM
jgi:hypothetical protein